MWWLLRAVVKRFSRFKDVDAAIAERQRFEQLSRSEIQQHQLERFNHLWQFACAHVPYYRELQQEQQLPLSFNSLAEISANVPILDKATVQADFERFLPDPPPPGFWSQTSGSTGTPMKCYWETAAYIESQRDKYYHQSLWGLSVWDKTATLWGFSHFFQENWKGKVKFIKDKFLEKIRNKIVFSVYRIDQADLRRWYRRIQKEQVRFLYALPNVAHLWAKANAKEPPLNSLKLVVVGGEPLFPYQKDLIEQVCNCPVAIEYGTIEMGLLTASYPDSAMHVCERGVLLETLPTATGMYEIVVTNLRNHGFPLIRYKIGDLTDAPLSTPPQGTATVGAIIGRTRDVFLCASGQVLNGLAFSRFFKDFPEIAQYQVIQESVDRVTVRLVCWTPLSPRLRTTIETKLVQILGQETVIELQEVEKIEPTSAGKHRFIISKVAVPSEPPLANVSEKP
ncbi:phenylacetate--CoA ligase family protein [Oculatella sp. LEGE 06141]|uniref:phenylacetate--CoA ligase family protein n=1 Tax=Oculatella sp. LEGE 06141 TaxID=1828648 RepID=UPI0018809A53|nr:phenylacetate--CoA ligase family protein [Oculatella sp. LEGE 06141]MBE9178838.1 phenylacetate--CoA ligase family protein [Oculatella sp. LEGE 06141]